MTDKGNKPKLSIKDQMMDYKMRHKKKLDAEVKKTTFLTKYNSKIELNPIKLAAGRIVYCVRKRMLDNGKIVNLTNSEIKDIPGMFRYRIKVNNQNIYTELDKNMLITLELSADYEAGGDMELKKIMLSSLIESYKNSSIPKDIQNKYIMIDLSMYGLDPSMPITLDGVKYYLSQEQRTKILNKWRRVNPESEAGKKFQLSLQCAKAMSEAYVADLENK